MITQPTNLQLVSAESGLVVVSFIGSVGIDHYDLYRSILDAQIGIKINVNPIPQTLDPYNILFQDDGVNSVSQPDGPEVFYYYAIAVDVLGNISLPSNGLILPLGIPEVTPVTPEPVILLQVEDR